jgi:BirA family biotin operon repressor/biotin-[acetyl-CoA-carboxylase] ligase
LRFLHDRSRFAHDLIAAAAARDRVQPDDPDHELWRAINGPGQPDATDDRTQPAFWSRLAIVESAPTSQFEALARSLPSALADAGAVAALAGECPDLHGFHERAWTSARGNLHLSAVIPLEQFNAAGAAALSALPAVAVVDAIEAATHGASRPRIKWVNDIWLGSGKVAGSLTRGYVQGRTIELVLLGIGVNVASAPTVPPTPFVPATAHLPDVPLRVVLREVLDALARRCEELREAGSAPLLAAYRAASSVVGRRVRIYREGFDACRTPGDWPAPAGAGVVSAVNDDLSLAIEGAAATVAAGRLAFEEDCRTFGLAPL